jgi:hypothetical protein
MDDIRNRGERAMNAHSAGSGAVPHQAITAIGSGSGAE